MLPQRAIHLMESWADYRPVRVEFEAVPMALSLANGKQIRWMNWKPVGAIPQELLCR